MSRIDELIAELCPEGVSYLPLGEVGEFIRGRRFTKADYVESGLPSIHYGEIYTHYGTTATSAHRFVRADLASRLRFASPGDLIIAATGENVQDVCKAVAWMGTGDVAVHDDCYIFRHHVEPAFVSYVFQSTAFNDQKARFASESKLARVSGANLAKIRIPLPPAAIQQEIVAILDKMECLQAELEAELELRVHQHSYYRDSLLSFDDGAVEWATIGDVCAKISSGGTPSTSHQEYYGGGIPWLRTQEVDYSEIHSTGQTITEEGLANSSANWIPANCVVVAMYGATAAKVAINAIPLTTNQACCNLQIDPERANHRYVFHWISRRYAHLRSLGEGSQSNLNAGKVRSYPIPVPSLGKQARIVELLDSFDSLVNNLSSGLPAEMLARRQQYEYYRDKLLTFDEAV